MSDQLGAVLPEVKASAKGYFRACVALRFCEISTLSVELWPNAEKIQSWCFNFAWPPMDILQPVCRQNPLVWYSNGLKIEYLQPFWSWNACHCLVSVVAKYVIFYLLRQIRIVLLGFCWTKKPGGPLNSATGDSLHLTILSKLEPEAIKPDLLQRSSYQERNSHCVLVTGHSYAITFPQNGRCFADFRSLLLSH